MPTGQACRGCGASGHNRTTCPRVIAERESNISRLEALVERQSSDVAVCQQAVRDAVRVIESQKQDLELEGLINQGLRDEISRKDSIIRQLESRLAAFAVNSNPRRY